MPVLTKAREALDLDKLHPALPASIKVVGINVEDYVNAYGEDALRVQVMLDESVDVENVSGEDVGQFKWAIRERLRQQGIEEFAYIFVGKQSEIDELDNDV